MTIGPRTLIVEGGAMRGAFSCGVLDTFLDKDFSPFDSFWGVSSGSTNIAAYLAKMPGRNHLLYTDYALRKNLISPFNLLRGKGLVDIDWLWDIAIRELSMDYEQLERDGRPFYIAVTNAADGQCEYHLSNSDIMMETLKASCSLPVLCRRSVRLGNQQYFDGGVADSIPVSEAIRRGATDIMVIRSQPYTYTKKPGKAAPLMRFLMRRHKPIAERLLQRAECYNQTLGIIRNPPPGIRITEICPPEHTKTARFSRSKQAIENSYQHGRQQGETAIQSWPVADHAAIPKADHTTTI